MGGLARGTVVLEEYSSDWVDAFELEKSRLISNLEDEHLIILHVGSTAIPGMIAKPIIDILLVSEQLGIEYWTQRLEGLGYHFRENGCNEDSIFFACGPEEQRTHYLRITYPHSRTHIAMIYFRDTLRSDGELARQYRDLKIELAQIYPEQRAEYTKGKESFVNTILRNHPHLR